MKVKTASRKMNNALYIRISDNSVPVRRWFQVKKKANERKIKKNPTNGIDCSESCMYFMMATVIIKIAYDPTSEAEIATTCRNTVDEPGFSSITE